MKNEEMVAELEDMFHAFWNSKDLMPFMPVSWKEVAQAKAALENDDRASIRSIFLRYAKELTIDGYPPHTSSHNSAWLALACEPFQEALQESFRQLKPKLDEFGEAVRRSWEEVAEQYKATIQRVYDAMERKRDQEDKREL